MSVGPLDVTVHGQVMTRRSLLGWAALAFMYLSGIAGAVVARNRSESLITWSSERGLLGSEVLRLVIQVGVIVSCTAALAFALLSWFLGEARRKLTLPRTASQLPQVLGVLAGIALFFVALVVISP